MRRLAIFAHYDAQNEVKRYVLHYLDALAAECDRVAFLSTAELDAAEKAKLEGRAASVDLCENVGLDFGMWKHALGQLDVEAWDEIVLVNSSVFGPLGPLGPIFEQMAEAPCDFWGMTDNVEIDWHIQSYFLVFKKPVLVSPHFRAFWTSLLPYRSKNQTIRSYEVGLSVYLCESGFRPAAFVSYASLGRIPIPARWRGKRHILNPTCRRPLDLLERGMPFVKIELLRDNPAAVPLEPVYEAIQARGFDMSLIEFDRPIKKQ